MSQRNTSTEGYTPTVNVRQHRGLFGLFCAAALLLGSVGSAQAQEGKAPPPAKGQPTKKTLRLTGELVPPPVETPEERAGKGVVVLQRAGVPVGLGMVLANDGRILTALSPLGSGNDLEARFADDSVHKVKLGHHDRIWDLALLVPQTGKWAEGLVASNANPLREDAVVKAFSMLNRSKPAPGAIDVRSKRSLIGGDDTLLKSALEIGSRIQSKDLGSPLIDERGRVLGILGRACLPGEGDKPCAPVAFGIPVSAIKSFLKTVPADAVPPSAWLGIQGAADSSDVVKGVRVLSVAKGSPAASAKLKGGEKGVGDMIVAVGGEPVTTPEQLAAAIKKRAVGEKTTLTLFSKGKYRHSEIVLRAPPEVPTPPASKARLAGDGDKEAARDAGPAPKVPPAAKPKKAQKAPPKKAAPSRGIEEDAEGPPDESDPFSQPL